MIKIKATILIVVITGLFMASCGFPKEERVLVASETDSVLVVPIPNAGCKNCQRIMEGKLQKEKGVKQTILNLHTKEVSIVYESNVTSKEHLESKVNSLKSILPCK